MIHPKDFYKNYIADDNTSPLTYKVIEVITDVNPIHVLEFGCGSGKNISILNKIGINTLGVDISMMSVIRSKTIHELPAVMCADESYLRNLVNFDVVFTMSVLDHIEEVEGIINEFKRICNKRIVLAETNDVVGIYYYPHDYESYGFKDIGYSWDSNEDGAEYKIWVYDKCAE